MRKTLFAIRPIVAVAFIMLISIFLLIPSSASATFSQLKITSWDIMYVTYMYPPEYGTSSHKGYAGEFTVTVKDAATGTWSDPLPAFCVDLDHTINKGVVYDMTQLAVGDVRLAWLMDTYAPTGSTTSAAGVQSSIWETLYNDNFDLLGPANVLALQTQYLTALANITNFSPSLLQSYSIASIAGHQNLIFQTGSPVPEPSSIMLFLFGLAGFAGVARNKISRRR